MTTGDIALELVTTRTADDVELDGALYRPRSAQPVCPAVLMIHGLTWNFYRGPARWLPPLLGAAGLPCLSLNMRDHDETVARDFELSHHDITAGLRLLARREPSRELVIVAHGYACNKVVAYPSLSGGDGPHRLVLTTFGAIKAYRQDIWDSVLGCGAALQGSALVVQGETDPLIEARARAEELAAAAPRCRVDAVLLEGADHYFNERHRELADCIVRWLKGSAA